MADAKLRIALLGGVPPSLGGGGLEVQVERTARALLRRGHDVFHAGREPRPRLFDVLHVFSSGPDVAFQVSHWRRNTDVPLIYSPVLVIPPGLPELRQRVAHRLRIPEFGPAERRGLLRRAAAVVALTEYEARLVRDFSGAHALPVVVVPNGVDPAPDPAVPVEGLPEVYVALVGTVTARKRQRDVVDALARAGGPAPVVLGGFEGTEEDARAFGRAVARAGGIWLGDLADPGSVRLVIRGAQALVHLSAAEGQSLAVLEAVSEGTPVVASPIPSQRELAVRYPLHVLLADSPDKAVDLLGAMGPRPDDVPRVPTWDDVARELEGVYRRARERAEDA